MNKKVIISLSFIFSLFLSYINPAYAAISEDHTSFTNSQYSAKMNVSGDTSVAFIKSDGSEINYSNPIVKNSENTFGLKAKFNLSNINEVINSISNGGIPEIPQYERSFISMFKNYALISGSFQLNINLKSGLEKYFSINESTIEKLKSNPNSLIEKNSAYSKIFNVTDVSLDNDNVKINVQIKEGVTGAQITNLSDEFKTLDFELDDLLVVNPNIWSSIDQINKGEFQKLVEVSAPSDETIFIVNIPSAILNQAQALGLSIKNPYVGVKLVTEDGFGDINFGYVIDYDGNDNTSGIAPVDSLNPYGDQDNVKILNPGNLERNGYTFLGWSNTKNYIQGNSKLFQPGDIFKITNNMTLYAQWGKNVQGAAVTAKYVDTDGNMISADKVYTGNVGDTYTTEKKDITGYTFKEVKGSETGKFTTDPQTVTYVYQKENVTPNKPSDPKSPSNETTTKTILPKTGEQISINIFLGLIGIILIICVACFIYRSHKTKE